MRDEGEEEEGVGSSPPRLSPCRAGLKAQVPSGFFLGPMRAATALASSSPSPSASQTHRSGKGRLSSRSSPPPQRNPKPFSVEGSRAPHCCA